MSTKGCIASWKMALSSELNSLPSHWQRYRVWRWGVSWLQLCGAEITRAKQVWMGTSNDWLGSTDRPTKEQGGTVQL